MRIDTYGANNIYGMNDALNKLNQSNMNNSSVADTKYDKFSDSASTIVDQVEIGQTIYGYRSYNIQDFNLKSSASNHEDKFAYNANDSFMPKDTLELSQDSPKTETDTKTSFLDRIISKYFSSNDQKNSDNAKDGSSQNSNRSLKNSKNVYQSLFTSNATSAAEQYAVFSNMYAAYKSAMTPSFI